MSGITPSGVCKSQNQSFYKLEFPSYKAMVMLKSVEGVYQAGKIKLLDMPKNVDKAKVIVTFIPKQRIALRKRGIDKTHALHLRARLKAFAQDWRRPDMNAYDEL